MKNAQPSNRGFIVLLLGLAVFLAGWERVSLKECLDVPAPQVPDGSMSPVEPGLLAYTVLERATSASLAVRTMNVEVEAWLESPLFHIRSQFRSVINNLDNYKTVGRISTSFLLPHSFSTATWVESYHLDGVSFTWDRLKRKWEREALKITSGQGSSELEYGVLRSMFTVNESSVEPSTVKLLGRQVCDGRECFVLSYALDPGLLKRRNLTGDISVKSWIDARTYLPHAVRVEGKIADMYLLESAIYSGFDEAPQITPPEEIASQLVQEKERLLSATSGLAAFVAGLRAEKKAPVVPVEFKDRPWLRDHIAGLIDREYGPELLRQEEFVFKWLGLVDQGSDYRTYLVNTAASSLAGLYDEKEKKIYLGGWVSPVLREAVVVHELAHAASDAENPLTSFLGTAHFAGDFDALLARKSLVEGDAMAAMLEYILRKDQKSFRAIPDIFALIEERLLAGDDQVKENMQYTLYGYGARFVQSYLRQHSWPDISQAYRSPPVSMKEVIHPFLYKGAAGLNSVPRRSVAVPERVLEQWKQLYTCRIGEFLQLLSLRQRIGKEKAHQAAAGMADDAFSVYENKDGKILVIYESKWDNATEATEFFDAYKEWIHNNKIPYPTLSDKEKYSIAKTSDGQTLWCALAGRVVRVVWAQGIEATDEEVLEQTYVQDKPSSQE